MDPWEQSQTVDPEVRAYVYSLVQAVGGRSTLDGAYSVGDDALATLKDLRRWLLLYDEQNNRLDVKRILAEANLVTGDLLEILALWTDDAPETGLRSKLAFACLELLVPLTWPLRLSEETATVNTHRHLPYISLAQVKYKRAILHYEGAPILSKIIRIALPSMAIPKKERSRRDEGAIMLMMILFKHVVEIVQPQDLPSQGDENDISRAAVIEAFASQDVFNLLLTIGSGAGDEFVEHDVELLEVIHHLLKAIDPSKLFMKKAQVMTTEMNDFKDLLAKEKAMLKSHNKTAPTRHNRFGTMIWLDRADKKRITVSGQNSITNQATLLQQVDNSKVWNKPKYKGRIPAYEDDDNDFVSRVDLDETTKAKLRQFVEDFLDSSFNPLFASLRKGIERELDRVKDSNISQYFYLMNWFLKAEAARHDSRKDDEANGEENSFAYLAAVLDQETFVLLNRSMQRSIDEKNWPALQSSMLALTQILETVKRMSESKNEEDQEIAENILNRIFYEEATHDRIALVLRNYTHQGFSYLDTITECSHVFVRMLEQYSKQNEDIYVRSKRRSRKKTKQSNSNQEADAEQIAEDRAEAERTVKERKFDFARFVSKFQNQASVNTFVAFLKLHKEMNDEQIKRCHRFFYRLAFKNDLSLLLFRIDIIALFQGMTRGADGLNRASTVYHDWETLICHVFRKCIKWLTKEVEGQGWLEMCVVEMLFSKIPNTQYYLKNGVELIKESKAPRPPAELVFKASVESEQKIGIAVSAMIDKSNVDNLKWLKEKLEAAIQERQAWQDAESASRSLVEEDDAVDNVAKNDPTPIMLLPGSDEIEMALFKDKYFRLLMTSLDLERVGAAEAVDAVWQVPPQLTASDLSERLQQINRAEFEPPTFDDGMSALDMIRNKSSVRPVDESMVGFLDQDDEDSQNDEQQFPPNMREKRKRQTDDTAAKKRRRRQNRADEDESLSDIEARAEERRKKEREKAAKIKSKLFVTASDDESDAEADEQFFRQEEQRRRKMKFVIRDALRGQQDKERLHVSDDEHAAPEQDGMATDDGEESDVSRSMHATSNKIDLAERAARRPLFENLSSDEDSDQEPSDEESDHDDAASRSSLVDDPRRHDASSSTSVAAKSSPLKEVSGNILPRGTAMEMGADDDEDVPLFSKTLRQPQKRRAGFVLDDSDSD